MTDQHCERHEEQSNGIAAMKSSVSLLKWIIGLGIPVMMATCAALVAPYLKTIDSIQTSVIRMESIINTGALSDAVTRSEIEQIKRDITELKSRQYR